MRPIIQLRRTWNSITLPPIAVDPGDPGIGGVFGMSAPMGGMPAPAPTEKTMSIYIQVGKERHLVHSSKLEESLSIQLSAGTYIIEVK